MNIKETGKCCLCGGEYTMYGNNPAPVCTIPDARCCHKCNFERVLPARGLNHGLTYEEYLSAVEASRKANEQPVKITVEVTTENEVEEDLDDEEEDLEEYEEDLYVSCPVTLWDKFILDELKRASAATSGNVKGIIDNMLHFCEYCKEKHTY